MEDVYYFNLGIIQTTKKRPDNVVNLYLYLDIISCVLNISYRVQVFFFYTYLVF